MAIISSTSPLYGARGMVGGLVFRTVGTKTVVSLYERPSRRKQSELQQNTRRRFADASRYAKETLKDPAKRAYYVKKAKKLGLTSAYTAAITDFMRRAAITSVDASKLARKGEVTVKATKPGLDIADVRMRLLTPGGTELSTERMLIQSRPDNGLWTFRYRDPVPAGVRVIVEATDVVGNKVTVETVPV